jgi:NADH-ubiquinone oxidoreductase chain 5
MNLKNMLQAAKITGTGLAIVGGLVRYLPITYLCLLIASFSLVAFPFFSGFYSKDLILDSAFGAFSFSGVAVDAISLIGAIFTSLYSVKILYFAFLSRPLGQKVNYKNVSTSLE